jgi:hypothetical protein
MYLYEPLVFVKRHFMAMGGVVPLCTILSYDFVPWGRRLTMEVMVWFNQIFKKFLTAGV